MKEFLIVFLVAILSDNYVLTKFLGVRSFIDASDDARPATGMGISVILVLLLSTLIIWPLYNYVLLPFNLVYMKIILFVVVILLSAKVLELVCKGAFSKFYNFIAPYLQIVAINSFVLGLNLINAAEEYGFVKSIANSLGAGCGFLIAILIFAGIRSRIRESHIAKSFDGIPVTLVASGITALAFSGFSSVIQNIFG